MSQAFPPPSRHLLLPVLISLALGGCASQEYVQQEIGVVNKRIDELSGKLATAYQRIDGNALLLLDSDKRVGASQLSVNGLNQRIDAIAAEMQASNARLQANAGEIALAQQRIGKLDERLAMLPAPAPAPTAIAPETVVPAVASSAEPTSASVPVANPPGLAESGRRLDEIAAQLAAASQRIDGNTAAIGAGSERIAKVEAALAEARSRVDRSEAALAESGQRQGQLDQRQGQLEQRLGQLDQRMGQVGGQLVGAETLAAANAQGIAALDQRLSSLHASLETTRDNLSVTAREALERAVAAGKLAEGKLVLEQVFAEERSDYAAYRTTLNDADKQALKLFAEKLVAENKNIYLEIQGYTDNSGPAAKNLQLSRERAENVRRFLHETGGIPLHTMSVAAYGENRPAADNGTRAGRSKNRRVVIVVLK